MDKKQKATGADKKKIQAVADSVMTIMQIAALLIPNRGILERVIQQSGDRYDMATGGAAVLLAVGIDYEEKAMEAELHQRRAKAVLNLVDVIEKTERARQEFRDSQQTKRSARADLEKIFGM